MNNNPIKQVPAQQFNPGALVKKYVRHWKLFVIALVACLAVAAVYLKVKAPTFLVVSSMMIDDGSAGTIGGTAQKSAGSSVMKSLIGGGGNNVDNEAVMMGSESLAAKTIATLGINRRYYEKKGLLKKIDHYNDSPIEVDAPASLLDTLSLSLQFNIKVNKQGVADITVKKNLFKNYAKVQGVRLPANVRTPFGIFAVIPTSHFVPGKSYHLTAMVSGNVPAAEDLADEMTIKVLTKKADAIYMDVTDSNVKRGRDILNTMMRLYNERGIKEQNDLAINTGKFIDDRIDLIHKNLMGSEAEIESYKKAHKILDPGLQGKSVVTKQERSEGALTAMETEYRIASMIREFVSNPANRHSLIPFDGDTLASTASIRAYNELMNQRITLAQSARDGNQAMVAMDRQLNDLRANIVKGLDKSLQAMRIRIDRINQVLADASGQVEEAPTTERETRTLYREQGIQNEIYIYLLQKREENALRLAAATPKGKIIDAAYAHSVPVAPKTKIVIFLALFAGVVIPVVLIYLRSLFNTKFASQDELEALTTIPVIGMLGHSKNQEILQVRENDDDAIAERFRYVRGNIQFMLPGTDDKVVLVTSSVSGEGKTFVAANVAASFALSGKRTVLIDMDVRSPKFADLFKLPATPGVSTLVADRDLSVDELVHPVGQLRNLYVVTAGAVPPNPSELLMSDRVTELIDTLKSQFDIMVIDSAPVGVVSDTFSVAKRADVTVFVTRAGSTRKDMVRRLNRLVETKRLENVGLVLNDMRVADADEPVGYGYGKDKKH